jgi:hypothetical protein
LRRLAAYLSGTARPVTIGRERLRQILHQRGISFRRSRTWKESTDRDRNAKLDRIEYVTSNFPDRCFAFDQFGPLRSFVLGGSDHPSHPALARKLQDHLRWRNANASTPTSWPPSAANAPASATNTSNAGAGPGSKPPDPGERCWSSH